MKKLFLLVGLCSSLFTHANEQSYLEQAIRSIDVRAVKQIVENVSFTPREYRRYLALAGEVVRSREIWLLKPDYHNDVTTPSEMPSQLRIQLDALGFCIGLPIAALSWYVLLATREADKDPFIIGAAIGTSLVGKYLYDIRKCFTADQEQKERLRKKYEDSVTIQQLIYAADIVEC
jgi:hypothetical protein